MTEAAVITTLVTRDYRVTVTPVTPEVTAPSFCEERRNNNIKQVNCDNLFYDILGKRLASFWEIKQTIKDFICIWSEREAQFRVVARV